MFIKEKLHELGIDAGLPNQFCITNFSNTAVILEGKIKIISFSSILIKIGLGNVTLSITGNNLSLKDLSHNSLTITGKILEIK